MYIAAMQAPTGTVTLVFTDIQDSTPLWERHGPRFEDCLKLHNEIMRAQLAAHGGYEVKTEGDAFMIAFARATDAARFALAAQLALHAAPWPPEVGEVLVRMGLHTGEPICTPDVKGHMDYFGPAVNRAARVAGAGHGGQILLSEAANSAAAEALGDAFVRDLGEHRLKGLERPERIFQALPRELAQRNFPALQTLSSLPTNLPPQTTSFIGRDKEIRDLVSMLRPPDARPQPGMQSARTKLYSSGRFQQTKTVLEPAWLVTLTGPGGTGKTRLALRAGNELLESFEGGVWFVDLTTARTIMDVCQAVAGALGVPIAGKDSPEKTVANILQYRKPLLLILDNFEQVVQHGNATIGLWHQSAPNVRFITTSRAILGIAGEREFEVTPLPTPPKGRARRNTEHVAKFDGISLFVQRATEADSRFALSDDNAEAVAEICAELDGLPLAIELAASRVKVLKPAQMVKKLGQKFELLKSSRRDLTPRQQTMLGAIEWGYELLSDWEKHAFLQACVFAGGFFLDAAEAVIDLSSFEGAPLALDAVQGLREKSLLTASEGKYETRYAMYGAIRDYGRAKWKEVFTPAQQHELCLRHATFYRRYVRDWAWKQRGPQSLEALDRVEVELENIFAAQDWAGANGEGELAASVVTPASQVLRVRGKIALANERYTRLLAVVPKGGEVEAGALNAAARAAQDSGEWERAGQLVEQAWAILMERPPSLIKAVVARQRAESVRVRGRAEESLPLFAAAQREFAAVGDEHGQMSTLADQGVALRMLHRLDECEPFFAQAEVIARRLGDERALAAIVSNRGNVALQRGDPSSAIKLYEECEAIARRYNDLLHLTAALGNHGNCYALMRQWPEARERYEEALRIDYEIGNTLGIGIQCGNVAQMEDALGFHDKAIVYVDESIAAYEKLGDEPSIGHALGSKGAFLLNAGRWREALETLRRAVATQHRMGYPGSRHELRDRANLLYAEFKCGDASARERAAALLPLLENPPPKRDFTDEDLDMHIAQMKEMLA